MYEEMQSSYFQNKHQRRALLGPEWGLKHRENARAPGYGAQGPGQAAARSKGKHIRLENTWELIQNLSGPKKRGRNHPFERRQRAGKEVGG